MSEFCDVPVECVITRQDKSICEVPLSLRGKDWRANAGFTAPESTPTGSNPVANAGGTPVSPDTPGEIGIVGKYVQLGDAYLGCESAMPRSLDGDLTCAGSTLKTQGAERYLEEVNGLLVPEVSVAGVDGKIKAVQYAREHKMPFLDCA